MARLISSDIAKVLKKEFSSLTGEVVLQVFTGKGRKDEFNKIMVSLCEEVAALSEKISFDHKDLESEEAKTHRITTSPVLLLNPEKYSIRFMGIPMGEEGRSLVAGVMMVSRGKGILSEGSVERLKQLKEPREVTVFVTPTCPLCPQQVAYAVSAAVEVPDKISVRVVETYENKELAERFSVVSVPQTMVNENIVAAGLQPEEVFVDSLISGAPVERKTAPPKGEVIKKDVVIVGAGPAGLTAAIYTERSGLATVVLEKGNIGGQVAVTPVVENYPGYTRIPGKTLTDMMAQQALQYTEIRQGEEVLDIRKTKKGIFHIKTTSDRYETKIVIFATGAEHTKLKVPGEDRLFGRGVSYCAVCDGYYFKDGKKVIMVGGGNTAATEALYLDGIGADVTLVHRRDRLRAEERLRKNLEERGVPILWNTIVEEIQGDNVVTAVKLKDLKSGKSFTMPVEGVFVAVGYDPVNELARKTGLGLTEEGYIKVDEGQRTSIKGIYAAGDITGGIKQIVTAVGQGSVAAITAFEDIMHPYWKEK